MSGELWTDYNTHDPGITMTDLLNYALTELDYRLRFDMPDYLSADPAGFQPGRYGLFSPVEVFPTVPVTPEDYRKLMIDAVDEIENLWIYPSGETGGGWYDITGEPEGELPGCRAYRVIAGCGKKGKGKYALLEATALHCYGSHRRIHSMQSWFGIHFNRLRLRWYKRGETWRLQIRTRCDYGEEARIRFQVSELWQDHYFFS